MLEEGLINHPVVGFGESGRKASELRILLAKIEESEVCVLLVSMMIYCDMLLLPSPLSRHVHYVCGPFLICLLKLFLHMELCWI